MSRKRRILVLTEAEFATVQRSLSYCIEMGESAEYDGDHDKQAVRAFERSLEAVNKAPIVDAQRLSTSVESVASTAYDNSCSCPSPDSHARDCWVSIARREIDDAMRVAGILKGNP